MLTAQSSDPPTKLYAQPPTHLVLGTVLNFSIQLVVQSSRCRCIHTPATLTAARKPSPEDNTTFRRSISSPPFPLRSLHHNDRVGLPLQNKGLDSCLIPQHRSDRQEGYAHKPFAYQGLAWPSGNSPAAVASRIVTIGIFLTTITSFMFLFALRYELDFGGRRIGSRPCPVSASLKSRCSGTSWPDRQGMHVQLFLGPMCLLRAMSIGWYMDVPTLAGRWLCT